MKIITFINEKGGVGKTTLCKDLAWELSQKKKILMIDLDGQGANLTFFCGVEKAPGAITIAEILQQDATIADARVNIKKNLDLIPAHTSASYLSETAKLSKLKKGLDAVEDEYDYVFIDVNPTPSRAHTLSLSVSDHLIIPMLPDVSSLEAIRGLSESIEEIQDTINPSLSILGVVFIRYTANTNLTKQVAQITGAISEQLNTSVFKTTVRTAVVMGESVDAHIGVTEYAPKAKVSDDIRSLAKEVEQRIKKNK